MSYGDSSPVMNIADLINLMILVLILLTIYFMTRNPRGPHES